MASIIVAVGSTRRPKVNAVVQAIQAFGPTLDPNVQFEVVGVDVPSGVGHTPIGRVELMAGARGRAAELTRLQRQSGEPWRYFVGLEGGLDVVYDVAHGDQKRRLVFLQNWAFVTDGSGREAYGQSGGILLPEPLADKVLDAGVELSEAIDHFADGRAIRDAQGAWGVLTRNIITRQESFRVAVIHAFAPFFNAQMYRSA